MSKNRSILLRIRLVKSGAAMEDRRGQYEHKLARTPDTIRAVKRAVEGNRRLSLEDLAYETGVKQSTVYRIIRQDLGLTKKSARRVPRLLSSEQKKKRLELSQEFVRRAEAAPTAFLASIVTMDESAVSFHTPESKKQSMQWLLKGSPGPIKARTQASRKKQMVFSFFDAKGLIYQHYAEIGAK